MKKKFTKVVSCLLCLAMLFSIAAPALAVNAGGSFYEDDAIARVRFSFGGAAPRPWSYQIGESCVGCGTCVERCMMDTIQMKDGRAEIQHYGCNECGICFHSCPIHAIQKQEFV